MKKFDVTMSVEEEKIYTIEAESIEAIEKMDDWTLYDKLAEEMPWDINVINPSEIIHIEEVQKWKNLK